MSLPAVGAAGAADVELSEVLCETFHDLDGEVAGFRASFFSTWELMELTPAYAWVRWEGAFAGNGTYEDAAFFYSAEGSSSISRDEELERGTLTLSEGGRVGSFTANGATLFTFSCGSAEKLATTPKPAAAAAVPPGTLRIWGEDVPVYEFPNIQCGIGPLGDFTISGDVLSRYGVNIRADGTGTGSHGIESFAFDLSFTDYYSAGGNLTLECGFPSRGTFELSTQGDEVSGAFTCPE